MKRLAQIIGILVVVLLGLFAWTFTSAKVDFTPLATETLPPASPPAGMTMSALPTGAMLSNAMFAYRGGSMSDKREFTMTSFLVHHPKGDLLFDAGFGRDLDAHLQMMPWLMRQITTHKKGRSVGDLLGSNDYPMDKLAGVILTHAHWDHVSGLDSLPPKTPVWVSNDERKFIASRSAMTALINSFPNVNYKEYTFNDGPYLGFPASYDVWGDGSIVLVPAPGHSPGSIVAFISLPTGSRYALLGDLVWQNEGVDIPAERPWISRRLVREDDDQVRENIARIAAIRKRFPEIKMVPAHDSIASGKVALYPASTR